MDMRIRDGMSRRSFLAFAAGLALAGCSTSRSDSQSQQEPTSTDVTDADATSEPEEAGQTTDEATPSGGKSLIVLWSWSGNTLKMAERVSELSSAEIYRIEAADPYPSTDEYDACADRAKQEQDDGVYPQIANPVENWDDYDTVFLGYPIWWYALPMIVQGFVRDHDWTGKTIVPFNSHEGSGDGGTYEDLREMTGTTVLDGIAIRGGDVEDSLDQINEWYAGLSL